MNRDTDRLSREPFDVLIVGGGIAGAGIARDVALRGLRTALIDQGDFGGGTSSRSSKLVHGGLRYLEHAAFQLVRESCRERQILLRIAPHLVRPLPILFPSYRHSSRPFWKMRLGLALYDLLAGGNAVIHPHQILSPSQIRTFAPQLDACELEGGGIYYDCSMNDARLCLENVHAAYEAGAAVANYIRLAGFLKSNGQIRAANVEDLESGRTFEIQARAVVNATGPWADRVRMLDDPAAARLVRTTRGIHLLTRRLGQTGMAATARRDGRVLFILPFDGAHGRHSIIGTTDTDSQEDPASPSVEPADVEYLLSETNALIPSANLTPNDVKGVFAGLRTLITGGKSPSSLSREYQIEESPSGLISLIGGKYTTYRVMAARVADRLVRNLGKGRGQTSTDTPLPSAPAEPMDVFAAEAELTFAGGGKLAGRYGTKTRDVLDLMGQTPEWREEIIPGSGIFWGEAVYAVRKEMVRRPMDFLRRRTSLSLTHKPSAPVLKKISGILQEELGLDENQIKTNETQAHEEWARYHSLS